MKDHLNERKRFAEKLRDFRKKNRVKQVELARAAGISNSIISMIEHGWVGALSENVQKIKEGYRSLGISTERLDEV